MSATYTISDAVSLQRVLWLKRRTRIVIALPSLSLVQQENLELRFNRQLSDFGSGFSMLALIAALVGCILFDASRWVVFVAHPLEVISANLFVCATGAALGNAFGVLRARWRLARLIWAVAELLDQEHPAPLAPSSEQRGERYRMQQRRASA